MQNVIQSVRLGSLATDLVNDPLHLPVINQLHFQFQFHFHFHFQFSTLSTSSPTGSLAASSSAWPERPFSSSLSCNPTPANPTQVDDELNAHAKKANQQLATIRCQGFTCCSESLHQFVGLLVCRAQHMQSQLDTVLSGHHHNLQHATKSMSISYAQASAREGKGRATN